MSFGARIVAAAWTAGLALVLVPAADAERVGVKIRFGLTDTTPSEWHGVAEVEPGRVAEVRGWRFAGPDQVIGSRAWKASTRGGSATRRTNRPGRERAVPSPLMDNGVTVALEDVDDDSVLAVQTRRGAFSVRLGDLPYGTVRRELDGAVEIERVAAAWAMTSSSADDDFPAAAVDSAGNVHVAWVRFGSREGARNRVQQISVAPESFASFAVPASGDQVLLATALASDAAHPIEITPAGRDVYGCAVAVDVGDRPWVFWAERRDGRFDVWGRRVVDGRPEEPVRLSAGPGNALSPVATADAAGRIWVAWQEMREGELQIRMRRQSDGATFEPARVVSESGGNSWAPTITATRKGEGEPRVAIAWDTYRKGDYDVWVREYSVDGTAHAATAVADSPHFEARPTATYDASGNLWVAWEHAGASWGKDWGLLVKRGTRLLANRTIGLIVRSPDGTWREPKSNIKTVMPRPAKLGRAPASSQNEAARAARPRLRQPFFNVSRIVADRDGRIWVTFRTRALEFTNSLGTVWVEYAAYYDDGAWTGPIFVPGADNLYYSAPAAVAANDGIVLVAATDHRQQRRAKLTTVRGPLGEMKTATDPWSNDLTVAVLEAHGSPEALELIPARSPPDVEARATERTERERADVARARRARVRVRGEKLELLRGEFHRHTEFSSDGGVDGQLEDMWRYAIDVAALDWVGNGDHDNGSGREYPWWLIQKSTDAFHVPGRFVTMFTYERSRPYPEGHRNVVFARRGIRSLPRLPLSKEGAEGPAPDTEMLYRYLREFDGISAPHTSATTMGTDWRNRDDEVEPIVEIYQGSRNSYEMPGAPRTAKQKRMKMGERPKGFVSNALAKGHRLGFVSSSDHHSTHISYAMLWVDEPSRPAILEALKKRRVYAATDDIVADVRMGEGDSERFMGEELVLAGEDAPPMFIRLTGTSPFARVVVVRDGEEVRVFEPNESRVELEWTDPEVPSEGTSHYYVRGEQDDGELVWTSPIWVTRE